MRIYALLVGINDYSPKVGKLRGAVNDANCYRDFLTSNFSRDQLEIECLLNGDATRQNIIDAFRNLLCRAGKDDVALFQFAGHGARWKAADDFKKYYPDGFDEGLICVDSRTRDDAWDLADKELAILLNEVAEKDPHIAVILDCCHSGSGTRSADEINQLVPRASHTIKVPRPLESYLDSYYANLIQAGSVPLPPTSRHMLMAGCTRYGVALESRDNHRGIFSKTLLDALDKVGLDVTYADLFLRVRSLVRENAHGQNPQFEAVRGFNAWRGFLNRLATRQGRRYSVHYDLQERHWEIDCGAMHGIPTQLDARLDVQLFDNPESEKVVGTAVSTGVGLNTTALETSSDFKPDWAKTYAAEITNIPQPQLEVFLSGDAETVKKLLNTTENSGFVAAAFQWARDSSTGLKYQVDAMEDGFEVRFVSNNRLIQKIKGTSESELEYTVQLLNRIANWEHALHLDNPSPTVDASVVELCCLEVDPRGKTTELKGDDLTFDITRNQDGSWSEVTLQFEGRNKTDQRLHLMLVWFDEQFGVNVLYNEPHDREDDRFLFQLNTDYGVFEEICFCLDDWEGNHATHNFKLFVSKDKIDDFLIHQPSLGKLGETVEPSGTQSSRGARFKKKLKEVSWFTRQITINLHRNCASIGNKEASLAEGQIRIKAHPNLNAGASLLPVAQMSRGSNVDGFTAGLVDQGFELLNFSTGRGADQSVLELNNIEHRESLSQQPLQLEVDVALQDDEFIVPVVFDGQHLLLAGDTWKDSHGKTQVEIDRIPEVASTSRSPLSAVKLYFFKTICGFKHVNSLSCFQIAETGVVNASTSGIGEKIHNADRILLLVHGIFGDSHAMAREVGKVVATDSQMAETLKSFDLVLGYNYESINTPIEDTARELKNLLKMKGLDETSDKKLTIVSHSMGGLVSRWLIEQEGGNQLVNHLLMLGTPNEGSPFGSAGMAATALNNLTNLAMNTLAGQAKGLIQSLQQTLSERSVTTTLSQMAASSEFMRQLNTSADPGVRYSIIAGNVMDYIQSNQDDQLNSLLAKIGASEVFRKLFDNAPHDVAVSVDSMRAVLDNRTPSPYKTNLSCHHLNYLLSDQGVECLKSIDWSDEVTA